LDSSHHYRHRRHFRVYQRHHRLVRVEAMLLVLALALALLHQ
jgi:hypothetical protein